MHRDLARHGLVLDSWICSARGFALSNGSFGVTK